MAGVTAQGGTFTFSVDDGGSLVAVVTGLSVETPQAEVADMTSVSAPASSRIIVPTGSWSGGRVTVRYIKSAGGVDPQAAVRKSGELKFESAGYSVTRRAILESASTDAERGNIVTGTLAFVTTDWAG